MPTLAEKLLKQVDAERLQERLFEMVCVPSLTGQAREAAEYYAGLLTEIGLPAELRALACLRAAQMTACPF